MPGQNDKINNTTIKKNGDLFFFSGRIFPQLPNVLEDSKKINNKSAPSILLLWTVWRERVRVARSHTHPLTMRLYETDPSAIALRS